MSCGSKSEPAAKREYVSVDCPAGDISLELFPGGAFDLVLRHWNESEARHTGEERLSGTWSEAGDVIDLTSGAIALRYRATMIPMSVGSHRASVEAMSFVSSSGTFADSFNLLSRASTDALFNAAAADMKR